MPTYEYVCKECGEHVEAVQAFSDPSLTTCAACGGPLRKVFGNVGIVFKGSGFYKTDSRASTNGSKGSAPAAGSSAGGEKADGGSGGAKEAAPSAPATPTTSSPSASSAPATSTAAS